MITEAIRPCNPPGAFCARHWPTRSTYARHRMRHGIRHTTVTSVPADPLPQAWLARFGRTATDHVVDAVSSRWHGGPQASHLTLGGPAEALLGWTGLGGQAARDTAADRGDSVRTEMASPRLLAPSGGAGPGVGGDRSGDDRGRD